jgi:hypothetical protein
MHGQHSQALRPSDATLDNPSCAPYQAEKVQAVSRRVSPHTLRPFEVASGGDPLETIPTILVMKAAENCVGENAMALGGSDGHSRPVRTTWGH